MKIRCTQDSIRMRVRKSDVAKLKADGHVEETLHFPNGEIFRFELMVSEGTRIEAVSATQHLKVSIPSKEATHWLDTDQVGLEAQLGALHLLIEKDFPCAHRPQENKADTFEELAD
ncbi:MAG: hypothetical protein MRY78_19935 [Saprospiraceae bacterium]|nr:hypothetical protein [Saprospiraceae bacterium]